MSTIIDLDSLDANTLASLRREAVRRGVDVGVLACELLREKFGPTQPKVIGLGLSGERPRMEEFAGTWSEQDAKEFLAAIADLGKVDEELWRGMESSSIRTPTLPTDGDKRKPPGSSPPRRS